MGADKGWWKRIRKVEEYEAVKRMKEDDGEEVGEDGKYWRGWKRCRKEDGEGLER